MAQSIQFDYYRFPIIMVFAAYLLENAILVLSQGGAFAAIPKQNDKCTTNAWGGGGGDGHT